MSDPKAFGPSDPLICHQPVEPYGYYAEWWQWANWMLSTPDPLAMMTEAERRLVASIAATEGGASKIETDPRPRLFARRVVSIAPRKSPGDLLIENDGSDANSKGPIGGRGEGRAARRRGRR